MGVGWEGKRKRGREGAAYGCLGHVISRPQHCFEEEHIHGAVCDDDVADLYRDAPGGGEDFDTLVGVFEVAVDGLVFFEPLVCG